MTTTFYSYAQALPLHQLWCCHTLLFDRKAAN